MGTFQIDFGSSAKPKRIIGIDLGTTNSLAAYLDAAGTPRVIPGADGKLLVPSVVHYPLEGAPTVGYEAIEKLKTDPARTVYSAKRLMGRALSDVDGESLTYGIDADKSSQVIHLSIGVTPPEVGAAVLRQLKQNAEAHLGEDVHQAVITVPAYFNDAQRQATKDAGRIAGLEVLRLVNEPTAAALAYGLDKRKQGVIAVYDLGGGTFDISILKLHDGIFEVMATNGDTHLGGDDIDQLLMQVALEDVRSEWGIELDAAGYQTLRQAVIAAKHALSTAPEVKLEFAWQGKLCQRELTREVFDRLIAPIVDRTLGPCRRCLADAGVTVEQIDEVVLVGGSTRIPLVRSAVENLFRARPHTELNPDEVVALGAAVQAGILAGEVQDTLLLDVTPLSLGLETMGGVVSKLIHRNSTIPASATETFTTAVDGQRNVLIHVVQGERELVKDNRSLARFDLKDIPPMPAGLPKIEVRFLIDANGILNVSAKELRSGQAHSMEVTPSYGLTDEQVEAMIIASIEHAEDDFRERQVREARVEADQILAALEKAKANAAWDTLSDDERGAVKLAQNQLLLAYHGGDHELILGKIEELNQATHPLAESMMNTAVQGALKGTKI